MENKDLERAIYMWFNMKNEFYNKLYHGDSIYLYDDGDKYVEVQIDKKYKKIYFNRGVWQEFSEIFPMEYSEFKEVISKWVGDTFNLMGFTPLVWLQPPTVMLEIPK